MITRSHSRTSQFEKHGKMIYKFIPYPRLDEWRYFYEYWAQMLNETACSNNELLAQLKSDFEICSTSWNDRTLSFWTWFLCQASRIDSCEYNEPSLCQCSRVAEHEWFTCFHRNHCCARKYTAALPHGVNWTSSAFTVHLPIGCALSLTVPRYKYFLINLTHFYILSTFLRVTIVTSCDLSFDLMPIWLHKTSTGLSIIACPLSKPSISWLMFMSAELKILPHLIPYAFPSHSSRYSCVLCPGALVDPHMEQMIGL